MARCIFRNQKLSSDLRGPAAARRRSINADDRVGRVESRDKGSWAEPQYDGRGGRGICNLRECLTGRARRVVEQRITSIQHRPLGGRAMAEMAQLMQHRAVLGNQQQQR